MTEEASSRSPTRGDWIERARRCLFGHLCPMILHETNNVLTVMSGIRQLLGQGRSLSDRIGPMLDSQLEKMEGLLGAIHGLGADETDTDRRDLDTLGANLESLVALAAKGRRLELSRSGGSEAVPGSAFEVLALSTLCCVLPAIPPRIPNQRLCIHFEAAKTEAGFQLRASVQPAVPELQEHPDLRLGASLIRAHGGTFSSDRTEDGGATVELALPEP